MEVKMDEQKPNALQKVWNIMSSIGGAVGLVSFVDDWYQWTNFIQELLIYYRQLVYWPFDWYNIEIPNSFKDYLFFGSMVLSSSFKSIGFKRIGKHKITNLILTGFGILLMWIIWPLPLGFYISNATGHDDPMREKNAIDVLIRLGAIVLIFFSFLLASVIIGRG